MTWHEDKEITPGVPDLSYVMLAHSSNGSNFETGWLELKASDVSPRGILKFHVEPSQHQWIGFHKGKIPIHFLIAAGNTWYFIDAVFHDRLVPPLTVDLLEYLKIAKFPGDRVAENSFLFSDVTRRDR